MILDEMKESPSKDQDSTANQHLPAAITDTGCERDLNEDRYAVIDSPLGVVWLICDGMGGVSGGELAAQLAIDSMRRIFESVEERTPEESLRLAYKEANRVIVLRRQNQAFSQMGTTVVGVVFSDREIVIGSVGDSRAYLVRGGAVQQLSKDHTFVQELVDRGDIRPEEALSHPKAHVLTRAIGAQPSLDIDVKRFWQWDVPDSQSTDSLVLCSDGLYSHVNDSEIAQIVAEHAPQKACAKLTELAKQRGGFDNITIAIIPLQGQVKKEPPPGYEKELEKRSLKRAAKTKGKLAEKRVGVAFWWTLLIVALSLIAVAIAVLGIFILAQS